MHSPLRFIYVCGFTRMTLFPSIMPFSDQSLKCFLPDINVILVRQCIQRHKSHIVACSLIFSSGFPSPAITYIILFLPLFL